MYVRAAFYVLMVFYFLFVFPFVPPPLEPRPTAMLRFGEFEFDGVARHGDVEQLKT